jgi:S-formylglutathione hydrolase FrmB
MRYGPAMNRFTRRAFLLGVGGAGAVGAAAALVNEDVLPGRVRAYDVLGLNGESASIPDVSPGRRFDGVFMSEARNARTAWSLSVPPGHSPAGLPLLVCLHGARADHRTAFDSLGVDRFLAQAVAEGVPPFVVASADGGATSYWHPRNDGTDASAMVMDELVPMLRRKFALAQGLGVYGWSMGGFGALRLALVGAEVDAVAACSPALFTSYSDAAPGAFDDERDYQEDGIYSQAEQFPGVPLRVDCGKGDPFYFPVNDFVERLPGDPDGGFEAGAHTYGYMRRMLPAQLAFIGKHVA